MTRLIAAMISIGVTTLIMVYVIHIWVWYVFPLALLAALPSTKPND